MKTSPLFSAVLACALLVTPTPASTDLTAGWSADLAAVQQASGQDTGGRLRAEAILRAVLDASRNGLAAEAPPADASLEAAAAHAAYAALAVLYPQSRPALDARLAESLATVTAPDPAIAAGRKWGEHVAQVILAEQGDAVFLNASSFVQEVRGPSSPSPVPEAQVEQTETGRYNFSVLAGAVETQGYVDGSGTAARFDDPAAIVVDAAGNAYVSEESMNTVRKISPDGVVTTLAGAAGQRGSQDGVGAAARFSQPCGLAVDGAGNVFVADLSNHTVRKIDPSGLVTTLAGVAGQPGAVDGGPGVARLHYPGSLAVDEAGNVFVADWGARPARIRKITPAGTVSTLAVTIPLHSLDLMAWPSQLCVDRAGNLYAILDDAIDYSDVVKLTPTGADTYVSTSLQPPVAMRYAGAIALDDAGNLHAKYESGPVYKFAPDGDVEARHFDGSSAGYWSRGMAIDGRGRLFNLPVLLSVVRAATVDVGIFEPAGTGPVITRQPDNASPYQGDNASFSVQAAGTEGLTYQWYFNAHPISGATGSTLSLKNVQDTQAGPYSVVVSDGARSVTSRNAALVVRVRPSSGSGTGSGSALTLLPEPVPPTTGGGSFDPGVSLVALLLLAAAVSRSRDRARPQLR